MRTFLLALALFALAMPSALANQTINVGPVSARTYSRDLGSCDSTGWQFRIVEASVRQSGYWAHASVTNACDRYSWQESSGFTAVYGVSTPSGNFESGYVDWEECHGTYCGNTCYEVVWTAETGDLARFACVLGGPGLLVTYLP